jgi:hypothetical protein
MTSTIQIEHQAESHREHISQLLDELRERATPGEVLDQFLGWEDGREIARTFGRQLRDNPLPLALIGSGIAWLMAGDAIRGRRPVADYAARTQSHVSTDFASAGRNAADATASAVGDVRDAAAAATQWTRNTASGASDAAQSALESARGTASDVADSAQSAMGRARQTASDTVAGVSGTAASAWQKTSGMAQDTANAVRQAGFSINSIARDQPLLVAGIGVALGMVLGTMLPVSDTENEMFGEQADALKSKAGEFARDGYGQAKAVVQRTYEAAADAANDEMEKQGLGTDSGHDSEGAGTVSEAPPEATQSGDSNGGGFGSSAYPHH